jgi:hypothetical protein
LCPFGGDNTVEENLGGHHVSCWCAAIARVSDSVTTHCKADAMRVFLVRSVVGADASVGDVFLAMQRDLVVCNKDYGVGAFHGDGDSLGKATKFFTICIFPYCTVLRVFDEMAIL